MSRRNTRAAEHDDFQEEIFLSIQAMDLSPCGSLNVNFSQNDVRLNSEGGYVVPSGGWRGTSSFSLLLYCF